MILLACIIFVAVLTGFLALIATFLRLLVEDWEAVEIDADELERLEEFMPTNAFNLTGRGRSSRP
jgi:hypothetical protein